MTVNRKKYSSGESLSELLIASLIISFAMIMLFSGVKVGSDAMRSSREKFQQYNDSLNQYEETQASWVVQYGEANKVTPMPEPTPYTFSVSNLDPHK